MNEIRYATEKNSSRRNFEKKPISGVFLQLRCLQRGEKPGMPHSRPMPPIGARCHELRIIDRNITWRIIYRTDPDAIVIVEIFEKETNQTPKRIINICKERLSDYDNATS